jgi:hypothetical protein
MLHASQSPCGRSKLASEAAVRASASAQSPANTHVYRKGRIDTSSEAIPARPNQDSAPIPASKAMPLPISEAAVKSPNTPISESTAAAIEKIQVAIFIVPAGTAPVRCPNPAPHETRLAHRPRAAHNTEHPLLISFRRNQPRRQSVLRCEKQDLPPDFSVRQIRDVSDHFHVRWKCRRHGLIPRQHFFHPVLIPLRIALQSLE